MIELREQTRVSIRMWVDGVGDVEPSAMQQIRDVASLPIVTPHVAIMPDVHLGYGATVGSVIPTRGAIIPSAVGVDIGCGMRATRTQFRAEHLDGRAEDLRHWIEDNVPVGGPGIPGSWRDSRYKGAPDAVEQAWARLDQGYKTILEDHPKIAGRGLPHEQLGTLGTGNHFIEVCLDENGSVWIMLHSGSRGVGNRIGTYFIERALEYSHRRGYALPNRDLGWLDAGTPLFREYMRALLWAQDFAVENRALMMRQVQYLVQNCLDPKGGPTPTMLDEVACHHNYTEKSYEPGVWVTRKGAVSARKGQLGIIPGSMGTRSYIVRGLGNPDSFFSCSHGAGRRLSRGAAKRAISLEDHRLATEGVACRKDEGMLDESPAAYKDIDAVMEAQKDLVEIVHTLRAVVCVKG